MSELLFAGSLDPWSTGSITSPDPVTAGDTSWTWDVEFAPVAGAIYAKSSLSSVFMGGDYFAVDSGIVTYRTRNPDGGDTVHNIGQNAEAGIPRGQNGLADFAADVNVDSVTFGIVIGSDDASNGSIIIEIWSY